MSLPVRVGTLLVAFLAVVGGAIFVVIHFFLAGAAGDHREPGPRQPGQPRPAGDPQTTVTNRPGLGLLLHPGPDDQEVGAHHAVQGPGRRDGQRDDPRLRRVHAARATRSGARSPGRSATPRPSTARRSSSLDAWQICSIGHTFSIPGIGLNVPMGSPTTVAANNNLCGTAPCQPVVDGKPVPHATMKFSFSAPTTAGSYMWQCRIPCGGGYMTASAARCRPSAT